MWRLFLIDSSGLVGAELDAVDSGGWSYTLNDIPSFTVSISKSQWRSLAPRWRRPWATGVLACWEAEGRLFPRFAGPITDLPTTTRNVATFTVKGIEAILERRVVLAREYTAGEEVWLAKSTVPLKGRSYGAIAQDIVHYATNRTGGTLPIVPRSPREEGSTLFERNYEGWNLANNNAWKRLKELTELQRGPDIAFRPEWVEYGRRIQWGLWHGTVAQPEIVQGYTMDLDTTAPFSSVAGYEFKPDSANVTTRHYETGAGEGAGTLIAVREDLSRVYDGMPLLETVGSEGDSENRDVVAGKAVAAVARGASPLIQLSMTVDVTDRRCAPHLWNVGDAARVTVRDEWFVPDGTRDWRIIAASGDWSSSMVKLEFQEDFLNGEAA